MEPARFFLCYGLLFEVGYVLLHISTNFFHFFLDIHSIFIDITGLSGSLQISNNDGNLVTVIDAKNHTYTGLNYGDLYDIKVVNNPVGQECTASNNTGEIRGDIIDVKISCVFGKNLCSKIIGEKKSYVWPHRHLFDIACIYEKYQLYQRGLDNGDPN